MVSEGFQRGLKPCGFRGVSEGFQRDLKPSVVSEGFQRGLKPSQVSEGFQRGLKLSIFIATSSKEFESSLGKNIQTQNNTSFYWENPYKKKH